MLEKLLSLDLLRVVGRDLLLAGVAYGLPCRRPPCVLSLVELHAAVVGQAAHEVPGLSSLILLGPLKPMWLELGKVSLGIHILKKETYEPKGTAVIRTVTTAGIIAFVITWKHWRKIHLLGASVVSIICSRGFLNMRE